MIVREIKDNPEEVLSNFDWFNDYDDTRRYLSAGNHEHIIKMLDEGFKLWLDKRNKKEHERNRSNQTE